MPRFFPAYVPSDPSEDPEHLYLRFVRGLPEAEQIELRQLDTESVADRPHYKQTRLNSAQYYVREAKRLKRGKEIVGHNWFMEHVRNKNTYSHQTALNYLRILQALDNGWIKFTTLVSLGLTKSLEIQYPLAVMPPSGSPLFKSARHTPPPPPPPPRRLIFITRPQI